MIAPTLYYLIIELNPSNTYEIWEQHKGQEKGCFMTCKEFVDFVPKDELDKFITEYKEIVESFGDKLYSVELIE